MCDTRNCHLLQHKYTMLLLWWHNSVLQQWRSFLFKLAFGHLKAISQETLTCWWRGIQFDSNSVILVLSFSYHSRFSTIHVQHSFPHTPLTTWRGNCLLWKWICLIKCSHFNLQFRRRALTETVYSSMYICCFIYRDNTASSGIPYQIHIINATVHNWLQHI